MLRDKQADKGSKFKYAKDLDVQVEKADKVRGGNSPVGGGGLGETL